ncbi:MazG-like family protein [Leptonema illini]|uniref:Uncharacterized protein n=1 Tax=Leptonema illini DSM 21528 TaxID=929563 RepID=H2CKG9_9LEPT|nr:MazG-like family protein [Leptonema illini]EHQ08274.1 hypothetical protein Lepil_3617 [Leptonema illini DSM 21528]
MNRIDIFNAISKERERQDGMWGEQNHEPTIWLGILGEEYGEVCKAAIEAHFETTINPLQYHAANHPVHTLIENYEKELIQVAAVAVAMIECLHRQRNTRPVLKQVEESETV